MAKLCDACRYDLRGSPVRGRCPECGHPFDQFTGSGVWRPLSAYERGDRFLLGCSSFGCLGVTFILLLAAVTAYLMSRPSAGGYLMLLTLILVFPTAWLMMKWFESRAKNRRQASPGPTGMKKDHGT